jgi:murein DD-endopeptidase MepM/ murein hydrolase activator NlpD
VLCGGGACSGGYHYGTDIGTGCSAPIYAAATGTVVYAGRYGTYGNFVLISHGNGVETGYAHIRDGGIFVSVGQRVDVGQNIASSGTTGASTGCHLHFEVRTGGNRINAVPFMSDRGAPIG